ncbi:hypothetical protein ABEV63_26155, partial [Brevibacillus panacihumi]
MNKKLVLSVLSTAVVASMASAAMAKPQPGFYVGGDVDKYYSIDAFLGDHFDDALDNIISELGDTVFVDKDANAAPFVEALDAETEEELSAVMKPATREIFGDNVYANVEDPTKPYDPAKDPDLVQGDLVVESVSAIAGTKIASGTATDLKFSVNGKEELTKAQFEEKYEGYTVTFKYNKTGAGYGENGKVNAAAGTFKYAVQVTDAEGNLIPEEVTAADFVEVTAVDASKATAVTEVGLIGEDGKAWTQKVLDGQVSLAATKYVNGLGQNQDAKDGFDNKIISTPEIVSVKSSNATVAYYAGGKVKVLQSGTVTFTIEFKDIEEKSTITFDVKTAQEVGSVVTENAKVAAGVNAKVAFKVLDQDGEKYLGSDKIYYTIKQAEGDDENGDVTPAGGEAEIERTFVKGDNTVTLFADADRKEKLGSFKVTAVAIDGTPDAYALEFADKTKTSLDMNQEKDATSLEVNAKAFINEIAVDLGTGLSDDYKLEAKSTNKNVPVDVVLDVASEKITVSLPADEAKQKVGVATVDLYTVEGALKTKVATISVEVKNTTPKFTTLTLKKDTLKKDTKVKVVDGEVTAQDVVDAVVEATNEENPFKADYIESVIPVEGNESVIVKIKNLYGGALIELGADFVEEGDADADAD